MIEKEDKICCSFCGKDSKEVDKLIKGSYVYICNECVHTCEEILNENISSDKTHKISSTKSTVIVNDYNAKNIKSYMDEFIVGQEEAKKILSVAIVNHFKRINTLNDIDNILLEKENVIMIGPSGTGKTSIVSTISKKLKIPFVVCDSTVLSEVGYVGADPDSIIKKLLKESNNDVKRAEAGIVFIDEIDKKSKKALGNGSKDASGEGVQQALLKIIEGTIVEIDIVKNGSTETVKVDTSNILFIAAGAFSGIDKIVKNRLKTNNIGFSTENNIQNNDNNKITSDDIIEYGIIPELIGRLPIIAQLEKLTIEELKNILVNVKNSIVSQYKKIFKIDGIDLIFQESVIDYIAEKAFTSSTGVRGLRTIIEEKLINIQFDIADIKKDGFNTILIDYDFFVNNAKPQYSYIEKTV